MSKVAIRSIKFPNHFIRLDGQGVSSFTGSGGGNVNTQTYIGTLETFNLQRNDDGTVSFESTVNQSVFLRMHASEVPQGTNVNGGGGIVNAQFTARSLERFNIVKKQAASGSYNGVVGIESAANPGRFLRMDGSSGTVNVQGIMATYEEFEILVVG